MGFGSDAKSLLGSDRKDKTKGFATRAERVWGNTRTEEMREGGKAFETYVKSNLKKKGYEVTNPKSQHYDWYATKGGKTYLIECKKGSSRLSNPELKYLLNEKKNGKIPVIVYGEINSNLEYVYL